MKGTARLLCPRSLLIGLAVFSLVAAAIAGGAGRAFAQDSTPSPTSAPGTSPATINVEGTGTVTLTPDAAAVTLGVTIVQSTLREAQAQATSDMNAVIAALKADGVAAKDIQTTNYSVSINQDYGNSGAPSKITGYTVDNEVSVTIRDLDKLGKTLDDAVAKGANTIYGINFMVSDMKDASSQARKLAVQDATDHAAQIAEAAGGKLGRVLSISETSAPSPQPVAYAKAQASDAGGAVPVQAGSTQVTVTLEITFEFVQ